MARQRATSKSKATWIAIIKEFLSSGLSKEDFCKNKQLNLLTFKSRYYNLNPKKRPLAPAKIIQSNFIPVTVRPRVINSELNIELPNGIKLGIIDCGFDSQKLQELLRVCCNVVNG